METTQVVDLQIYTRLPLKMISVAGKLLPDIFIATPTGQKQIRLKKEHYPFIFGSVTQTEKYAGEVIQEIKKIENEAIDYLIKQWKDNLLT